LLKASARNIVAGKVVAVDKGAVAAVVKVEVKQPFTFTAMITKEAVDDLNLKKGDVVSVMVKSTEVMILKD
jgi:molybdopterin-binding protein